MHVYWDKVPHSCIEIKKSAVFYSIEISASDLNFNMRFVVPFSLRLFLEPTEIMPWETYKKIIKYGNIDLCS